MATLTKKASTQKITIDRRKYDALCQIATVTMEHLCGESRAFANSKDLVRNLKTAK